MTQRLPFLNPVSDGHGWLETSIDGRGMANLHVPRAGTGVLEQVLNPAWRKGAVNHAETGHYVENSFEVALHPFERPGRRSEILAIDGGHSRVAGDGERPSLEIGRRPPDYGQIKIPCHAPLGFQDRGIGDEIVAGEGIDTEFRAARVEVDVMGRGANQFGERGRGFLGDTAIFSSRTGTGEVESVLGTTVTAEKRVFVHHRHEGDAAAHKGIVAGEEPDESADREDGLEFITMHPTGDEQAGTMVVGAELSKRESHEAKPSFRLEDFCLAAGTGGAKEKELAGLAVIKGTRANGARESGARGGGKGGDGRVLISWPAGPSDAMREIRITRLLSVSFLGLVAFLLVFNEGVGRGNDKEILAFLDRHCTACHDDIKSEGGLNLLELDLALAEETNRDRWTKLYDRVFTGEMPPPGKRHELGVEERQGFVDELGEAVAAADRESILTSGRGPSRRLTRVEYELRLRDLLDLPGLDIRDKLPEDRDSHGFTRVSGQLDISRVQLEGWLDAAEAALGQAIASGTAPIPTKKWRFTGTDLFPSLETFGEREAMFFARKGRMVPIDGAAYKAMSPEQKRDESLEMALFRSATWPYYGYPRGFRAEHDGEYRVRFSGRAVRQVADFRLVPAHAPQAMSFRARQPSGPDVSGDVRETGGWMDLVPEPRVFETTIRLKKGETFEYSPLGLPVPFIRTDGGFFYDFPPMPPGGHPGVAIQWMEVEGPLALGEWPPASHRILFGDLPVRTAPAGFDHGIEVVSMDPSEDSMRLLESFLERASCEPVSEDSLAIYHELVLGRLKAGDPFASAMLKAYTAILCSGRFLFLTEPRDDPSRQHSVAARLSHFLWSTAPDERLRMHADKGRLDQAAILRSEADRLIADPRFGRFVADFTDQWLNLRQLRRDEPDNRLYPEYRVDEYLVASMELETRAFFTAMVRDNLSVTSLVSTDFTYVNDRLARHYDLPRVEGSAMRKVDLPEWSPYGGLLTQASVLKVTANGTTTSPVTRGVWVLERLLGEAPPPPPKSVPAIEPDIRGATTIREILAKHTGVESCAACHARFDPYGFALENFDVMGAWRDRYRGMEKGDKITGIDRAGHPYVYFVGPSVEAAGKLRTGEPFSDVRELKEILTRQPRKLAGSLLGHLILYATGTPVRFSEREEFEAILDRTAPNGYRIGDLIRELVASRMFLGGETLSEP